MFSSNSGIENKEEIVSQEQCLEHCKNRHLLNVPPLPSPPRPAQEKTTLAVIENSKINGGDVVKLINISNSNSDTDQLQKHHHQQKNQGKAQDEEEEINSLIETLKTNDPKLNLSLQITTPLLAVNQPQNPTRDSITLAPDACESSVTSHKLLPLSFSLEAPFIHQARASSKLSRTPLPTTVAASVIGDTPTPSSEISVPNSSIPLECCDLLSPIYPVGETLPTPATVTIFAPRTADMNPGFLMPIGDENNCGLTVLPDIEACNPKQDLTHLAPQAGDYCVPLEVAPLPIFDGVSMDELLKEMGLVGNSVNDNENRDSETTLLNGEGKLSKNNTSIITSSTNSIKSTTTNTSNINSTSISKLSSQQIRINCKTSSNCSSDTYLPLNFACKNDASFMNAMICKNEMPLHDSDEENLPFTGYLTSDSELSLSKLSPFISSSGTMSTTNLTNSTTKAKESLSGESISPALHDSPITDFENNNGFSMEENILSTFINSSKPITSVVTTTGGVILNQTLSDGGNHLRRDKKSSYICLSPCSDADSVVDNNNNNHNNSNNNNDNSNSNNHNNSKIGAENELNNDPFLSFTNGCLATDNFLTSNLSPSNSLSNSPVFCSSPTMSPSPLYSLKRSSSLSDSPTPSSCNSTLTSYLDICGSFVADDDINNNVLDNASKKSLDDSFTLLSNDDFIWDSLVHSNISDLVNDADDDNNIFSDNKAIDNILNQDTSSTNSSCTGFSPSPSSSSSSLSSSSSSSTLPLNSNLAMLLQKESHLIKPIRVSSKNDIFASKKNQGKNRLHTYSSHTVSRTSFVPSPKRAYFPSKNSSENNHKRMKLPSSEFLYLPLIPTRTHSSLDHALFKIIKRNRKVFKHSYN